MRILHTANTYAPLLDGVAEVVRHISQELARRGHEIHVATHAVPSQPAYAMLNGVHIHRFAVQGSLARGMVGDLDSYRKFIQSGHWDIMVNHCLQTWSTDALLEDVGTFPWPSLLVTHGLTTGNPIYAAYYRTVPRFIRRYAGWVTVSALSEEAALAKQHDLAPPIVIRNGVDLEEWKAVPLGLRKKWNIKGRFWLVNVSNHSHQKCHRSFFQFAEHLHGIDATFTIIGNPLPMDRWRLGRLGIQGGCFYECQIRSSTSRLVELRTAVPRREVVSAIQEADLIVSTSRWEANSVVLLESMAAGTAWISTDVGSVRENVGGIVASSPKEMADAAAQLLLDGSRRKELGAAGLARARERHDWKRITDAYEQLYQDVVGRRRDAVAVIAPSAVPVCDSMPVR